MGPPVQRCCCRHLSGLRRATGWYAYYGGKGERCRHKHRQALKDYRVLGGPSCNNCLCEQAIIEYSPTSPTTPHRVGFVFPTATTR